MRWKYLLRSQAATKLVQTGFYSPLVPLDEKSLVGGVVRNHTDALSVLQDTHQVLHPCCLAFLCPADACSEYRP
jgi:hypothetical protein